MELSIEELLFAHRIGATMATQRGAFKRKDDEGVFNYYDEGWITSNMTNEQNQKLCHPIDFTPLYDWIDHDGSAECPVNPEVEVSGAYDVNLAIADTAGNLNWKNVVKFKLTEVKSNTENWSESDEQRQEVIDQNGNTGEHYRMPALEPDPREIISKKGFVGSKSKYHREISPGIWVDVYDVLKAWNVTCPALQHLTKKALQPGERGHKTLEQDMKDIVASAKRAQELNG